MIPSSKHLLLRKQQHLKALKTIKAHYSKNGKGLHTYKSTNANRVSGAKLNQQSTFEYQVKYNITTTALAAAAVTLLGFTLLHKDEVESYNNDTGTISNQIKSSSPFFYQRSCQCEAAASANTDMYTNQHQQKSSFRQLNNPKNQPRNVMVHRLRSYRGRGLNEKYNVEWKKVLGEGAYGSVHPARLAATGEKVALKKITKRYTNNSSFCRETDALLRIYNNGGHPNINGLRDMYEDYDHYYLVMDLVSGGEMFDHLVSGGAYSEADAARLMMEVASALAFLHGVGVVHADLKPENILLCSKKREDGTVKIIDFGCAKVKKDASYDEGGEGIVNNSHQRSKNNWIEEFQEKSNSTLTQADQKELQFTGTTAYWPPERYTKGIAPDTATDMWAVGVILFIMLTGVHPFDLTGVATDAEIEKHIQTNPSPPITPALTSHLSPSAIDLIKKLFAKNPKDRLTASEMMTHPWIADDEATTEVIEKSDQRLSKFKDLREVLEAGIFSMLVKQGNREMILSEYTPKLVYKDDRRDSGRKRAAPATSILKRAFETFDEGGKGFVSADDLGRIVSEHTDQQFSENEKKDIMAATTQASGGKSDSPSGLSLSSFSKVFPGLKHKHYPRGHIIFHAGDEGNTMYFINSGKVEIQTRKGQLVHILRHGDFFGEGSLLEEDNKRFSSAKCATPVDLIKINRSDFEKYIENSKETKFALKFRWKARTLADAKAMIRLQTNVKPRIYRKGDVVYREGDKGDSMFIVDEVNGGELDVKHDDVTVLKHMKGETFGESSLLMGRPRSSTVICNSDKCLLHEMAAKDFMDFLETSPDTKAKLLNMCRKRLFKKAVKAHSFGNKRGVSNDDLTKAFQEADLDQSGDLGLDEVRKLMHAMDPTIEEKDIVELMKFIDVDEDGKLNLKDFKRLFRSFSFDSYEEAYRHEEAYQT